MKRNYFCPQCNANLNPNIKIILMARTEAGQGLILLSPQPGNYELIIADELDLKENDIVELRCPVCGVSITADSDESLAHLTFKFSTGREGTVFFSRRVDHHATYFVFDDEVLSFGENAIPHPNLNFFGSGQDED